MENPWFGRKANGYTGGPVTWQGWLAVIVLIGGGMTCHLWLKNDWAAAACIAALAVIYWLTYDPDTQSY
ncbi:MAG TPA: hypothetical protein VGM68_13260 [Rhizomicrobium sp.]|jgi:hypothetical protein